MASNLTSFEYYELVRKENTVGKKLQLGVRQPIGPKSGYFSTVLQQGVPV